MSDPATSPGATIGRREDRLTNDRNPPPRERRYPHAQGTASGPSLLSQLG